MGYRYKADPELTRKQAFEATKNNWRLVQRGKYGLVWENKISRKELSIYDLGARLGDKPSGYWAGHYNDKLLFKNINKTKAQALKYAKAYMKKH